jgi:uncharacterized RDD family membrane protein YckC
VHRPHPGPDRPYPSYADRGSYGYPPAPYGLPVLATYGQRVGSYLIDVGIPMGLLAVVLLAALGSGDLGVIVPAYLLGSMAMLGFVIWNSGYRQGTTGQSIGKKTLGVRLVGAATGRPIGFGPAVGRQLAHLLDAAPFQLGFLWPLWDGQRQTFADKLCCTLVVQADL